MKRMLTLCLLLPLAGFAATPPASSAARTSTTDAVTQRRMADLQARMNELAQQMATLSVKIGNDASASALRYLADSRRGMLGIAASHGDNGTRVTAVSPGGPAERAGVKVGDVITRISSRSLSSNGGSTPDDLSHLQVGYPAELTILRDGKTLHLEVTPERFSSGDWQATMRAAERAAHAASAQVNSPEFRKQIQQSIDDAMRSAAVARESAATARQTAAAARKVALEAASHADTWRIMSPWWGLNLAPLNPDLGHYFGTDHGALVLSRDAKRYPEIEPGDVITKVGGTSVARPQDAMRAFRDAPDDKPVAVTVRRHGKPVALAFKAPPRWLVLPPPPPPAPPVPPLPPAPPAPPASSTQ